jgi:hypothetical protein
METKKRKYIISFILSLFILSGLFFFFFYSKNHFVFLKKTADIDKTGSMSASSTKSEDWMEYQKIINSVRDRNLKLCYELKDASQRQKCVIKIAQITGDEKICTQLIEESDKQECKENIRYFSIITNGKVSECASLKFGSSSIDCFKNFISKFTDIESCSLVPKKLFDICRNSINYHAAYKKKDKKACSEIKNDSELKNDCESIVMSIPKDSDADGLEDVTEKSLGFDPFKKDTNGNGVGDLEELRNKTKKK